MTSSLSGWWASNSHRTLAHTTDKAIKLALALTPIKSVIRVIDNHVPPMTVEYAGVKDGKSLSYTDFKNGRIRVNPLPFLEGHLADAAALDVEIGFSMHEASHGMESRDRYRDLIVVDGEGRERPAFRPMRVAAYLWNLAEDVRIEGVTSHKWPGFAPYFDAVLDYMWGHLDKIEQSDGEAENTEPHPALSKAIKTVYLACRYPARWRERLDASEEPEIEWWKAWQTDYLAGVTDTKETIQRGLDHLALDEEVKQEMEQQAAEELAEEAAGEALRKQIERLMREGLDGSYGFCITEDGEIEPLDQETAEKVDQLVREGLIAMDPIRPDNGSRRVPLHIRKPEETTKSKRAYVGKPNAESEALRAALVFRSSAPQFDLKLLRQGVMDDEELYRWGMGDMRVFSERVIEAKPDVFMGLLVDLSGSMAGEQLRVAQRLAQLFVWALRDQEGVTTQVWGHTGDCEGTCADIYRIWEKGDSLSRIGLIDTLDHSNNYDGLAVAYCLEQIRHRPEPQKVLLVLSDGIPSGHGYGGEQGMQHVRQMVEWGKREGITTIQIAIDGLGPEEQAKMYGDSWVPYTTTAALPKQLTRLMGRFT